MTGYGNGAAIGDDAKALVRRIADHIEEVGSFLIDGLLFMNGTDHQEPQPWLGRVVAEANAIQDEFDIEITSLAEYLAKAPTDDLVKWTGELRSGCRANVLMGVASNRVDVKYAAAVVERQLERRAEPFAALFQPASAWPARAYSRSHGRELCRTRRTIRYAHARSTTSSMRFCTGSPSRTPLQRVWRTGHSPRSPEVWRNPDPS